MYLVSLGPASLYPRFVKTRRVCDAWALIGRGRSGWLSGIISRNAMLSRAIWKWGWRGCTCTRTRSSRDRNRNLSLYWRHQWTCCEWFMDRVRPLNLGWCFFPLKVASDTPFLGRRWTNLATILVDFWSRVRSNVYQISAKSVDWRPRWRNFWRKKTKT